MNDLTQKDQQQRALALNPRQSFIVQAPAGSGKTELIIQRILTLLAYAKKPEEILAITFTKKSAHEMRARVLKALDQAKHMPEPDMPHEKLTWKLASAVLKHDEDLCWHLLANPNQLQIKTIDSFCSYLTGQLPLLSHFGSQPDIATYSQFLYRETILEILSHIEEDHPWSPSIARLLEHTDNDANKLADLLITMLQKRDQWQSLLFSNHDISENEWRDVLTQHTASIITTHLEEAAKRYPYAHTKELVELLRFAANQPADITPESKMGVLHDIQQIPESTAEQLQAWKLIADFLLTDNNEWRKKVLPKIGFPALKNFGKSEQSVYREQQKRHAALIDNLKTIPGLHNALSAIRILPPVGYTDSQWSTLKDLLQVLKISLAQLRVTFQLHGKIDFIENSEAASHALGDDTNPTDLALSLDYQIKHILVDEFQDTSYSQYRLLERLTYGWQSDDGRTLFVVGDPMQSIYRFRQAEVGIFIRMQNEGIGDLKLMPLRLTVNFRSTPQIVEWNNQQFNAIFPKSSSISDGSVEYNFSTASKDQTSSDDSKVTLKGFVEGDDHAQAVATIAFIQETLSQFPNEKIAILVRSRPHLAAIIPALKSANLRYNALEIDPLITRQCIQDCLALTRALIHPADRIAWLALLRAPWCGLTLSDMLLLCSHDKSALIWELLQSREACQRLSEDGQERIKRLLPILEQAINHRDRTAFREWVENTWLALGGPATLCEYEEIKDMDEYFSLLAELTSDAQRMNLEVLNERINELRATTHHDDAPIQIMTIHSAKGLEFDTVVLPHLEKANAKDDPSLLLWMDQPLHDDQTALLLAPLHATGSEKEPLYSCIEHIQKIKARYEVDRLFYVAATRAKKRLHLIFKVKDKDKATTQGSFLDKLWPLIETTVSLSNSVDTKINEDSANKAVTIKRFTPDWRNPVNISMDVNQTSYQNKSGFQFRDHTPRQIGTITHTIFQHISINGLTWWQNQSPTSIKEYIQRLVISINVSPQHINIATTTIIDLIDNALRDERGRWILSPHDASQSEYNLTINSTKGCENIIIDRSFIDEDGTRWIIDYKTAENTDGDLVSFLSGQKEKYTNQMGKYKHAISQIESRPIKLGLYFPALPAWCEW